MNGRRTAAERWLRLLLALYPADFRDEMGEGWLETYRDRFDDARRRSGALGAAAIGARALADSLRNGLGERLRPAAAWRRPGNWGLDAQRAVRRLRRAPAFTCAALATLALGLGGFGVVYSAVDAVLLEPPAYDRPEDLYYVWRDYTWVPFFRGWVAGTDVAALAGAGGAIEDVAGLDLTAATLDGGPGAEPEEVEVMLTTPNLFDLLGVPPALGRGFAPGEVGPDRPPVVVLGHDLWQRRFGGDPAVVGSAIRIEGEPFTVVGVTGPDFRFAFHSSLGPPLSADLYVPFDQHLAETSPKAGSYAALLRARPGSSREQVAEAVTAVARGIDERDFQGRGLELSTVGLWDDLVAPVRPALGALGVAAAFLLLVLAANLGALLLARAARREREIVVSRALGADRAALALAMLCEGGLLGLLGGAAGAGLAFWGSRALVALAPADLPRRAEIGVDPGVAAAVVGAGLLLGLAAGAVPAAWAARSRLSSLLGRSGMRGGGGHGPMRRGLVVVQVALSLALLSSGGLLARSLERLLATDPGFRPAGVLTARVPLDEQRYPEAEGIAFQRRLVAELASLPGVAAAGAVSALPLSAWTNQDTAVFPGAPGNTGVADHDRPLIDVVHVVPGALEALGMELVEGRALAETAPEGVTEAVVDQALARRFFPGSSALGRPLEMRERTLTVVGVVRQARMYDLHRDGREQVWVRNQDFPYFASLHYVLRTGGDPLELAAAVRAAVREIDPALPVAEVRTLESLVADATRQQRLSVVLVGGFAVGALALAAMGLYALVSGAVVLRRHELGVRMALGAGRPRVVGLVLGDGLGLVGLGLVVGLPGVYLAGRALRGLVVGISPFDPATLAAVAAGLALVAALACWLPARRVAAIDPARSLRSD